jgi:hypothetical protein
MNPGNLLLLCWVGWWVPFGPDHGRRPLFHSSKEAMAWAKSEICEESWDPRRFKCVLIDPTPPEGHDARGV